MADEQVTLAYRDDLLSNFASEDFGLILLQPFWLKRHVLCGGGKTHFPWLIGNSLFDDIVEDGVQDVRGDATEH